MNKTFNMEIARTVMDGEPRGDLLRSAANDSARIMAWNERPTSEFLHEQRFLIAGLVLLAGLTACALLLLSLGGGG